VDSGESDISGINLKLKISPGKNAGIF